MAFPSLHFYADQLEADDSVAARLLKDLPGADDTDDTAAPLVWIDTADRGWMEQVEVDARGKPGDSRLNPGEAAQVVHHVKQLIIEAGIAPDSIAVITPYNAQVAYLRDKLRESYPLLEIGSGKKKKKCLAR